MIFQKEKQPDETLDYLFDFTDWMPSGDSIQSSVVTADSGVTLGTKTTEGSPATEVRQFISGGTDGNVYRIVCIITTTQGRIKDADLMLVVAAQ